MDYSKEQLLETLARIAPNRYLQAFLIIVLFVLVAKIVDIILTRFRSSSANRRSPEPPWCHSPKAPATRRSA